jgi:hypothetical protein
VERYCAFHLLHDLVNMAVEDRYGTKSAGFADCFFQRSGGFRICWLLESDMLSEIWRQVKPLDPCAFAVEIPSSDDRGTPASIVLAGVIARKHDGRGYCDFGARGVVAMHASDNH